MRVLDVELVIWVVDADDGRNAAGVLLAFVVVLVGPKGHYLVLYHGTMISGMKYSCDVDGRSRLPRIPPDGSVSRSRSYRVDLGVTSPHSHLIILVRLRVEQVANAGQPWFHVAVVVVSVGWRANGRDE